ncbi:MAG TPA: hypothetical protein ENI85_17800 [Deltaproteobacteria bacterium]|nr:hypothetical protein [Deltaproteobacteria bacterium]
MSEDEESPEDFPGVDDLIGSFMKEASLWPVLVVVIASGGAFGAAMLVLTFVDRNPFAAAAMLLVAGLCLDVVFQARRHGRYRHAARLIGLIWCMAIAFAALAIWTGIA